ncbi:hypothetical protein KXD40_005581 [Peronospora effusa]|nr:hypothetical protein KXD40_005578 [Peronospora effusa]UIZ27664.1 hypothetical protein KXD40_005581 [Peronospora effusa]
MLQFYVIGVMNRSYVLLNKYCGTSARCIIDDGYGQAEIFLENEVAWELLMCTECQRQRFANICGLPRTDDEWTVPRGLTR